VLLDDDGLPSNQL